MGIFDGPKNAALKLMADTAFTTYGLDKLGKLDTVELDSVKKEILIVLSLHGEPAPVELTVLYRIETSSQVEIVEVRSPKTWVAILANEMVPADKKRIPVPPLATSFL